MFAIPGWIGLRPEAIVPVEKYSKNQWAGLIPFDLKKEMLLTGKKKQCLHHFQESRYGSCDAKRTKISGSLTLKPGLLKQYSQCKSHFRLRA